MEEYVIYYNNHTRCALSFCKNNHSRTADAEPVSFFKFPEDSVRCAIWVKNCGSKYLPDVDPKILNKRYKLCSLHFEDRMFNFIKNRLLFNAVPTLFQNKPTEITPVKSQNVYETIIIDDNVPPGIPIDPLTSCSEYEECVVKNLFNAPTTTGIVKSSVSLQTPNYLSAKSPRKLKLKKQLAEEISVKKQLEKTVNELKKQLDQTNTESNCLRLCEMYLPSTMYLLVKNYLTNKYKTPNGQRHLDEVIQFSQTVHYLGPKAYSFLQKHFTLPHKRTLKKKNVQNIDKNIQNIDKNIQNIVQADHRYSKIY